MKQKTIAQELFERTSFKGKTVLVRSGNNRHYYSLPTYNSYHDTHKFIEVPTLFDHKERRC